MLVQSSRHDGTRWRTGGEKKGKLANGVGSQYSSHYLRTWFIQHYYRWCAHLGCQQSTKLTPPADLNGLVRFAERRNLVSARVPSHFNWPLHCYRPTRLLPQNSVIFPVIILRASKLIHHLHKTNQIIFNTILTGSSSQIIYIYIYIYTKQISRTTTEP